MHDEGVVKFDAQLRSFMTGDVNVEVDSVVLASRRDQTLVASWIHES